MLTRGRSWVGRYRRALRGAAVATIAPCDDALLTVSAAARPVNKAATSCVLARLIAASLPYSWHAATEVHSRMADHEAIA
jgi:hypothetical protein